MNLLKEIGKAIPTVIQWIAMVYTGICDWLGISEWSILYLAFAVIAGIAGIAIYRKFK